MDYVKICVRRIRPFPIIKHTFLEINYQGKTKRIGFYNKYGKENLFWFFISAILPVRGNVEREMKKADKKVLITMNKQEVKRIVESIHLTDWKTYHALFRNCFHWRDEVLKRAGVKISYSQ